MAKMESIDLLFAAGQFRNPEGDVVDITVSTGQRPDPATNREMGHYIIDIIGNDIVHLEVPIGSREVRHPSVNNGVREAWSIIAGSIAIGFAAASVESPAPQIRSLMIGETKLLPATASGGITLY